MSTSSAFDAFPASPEYLTDQGQGPEGYLNADQRDGATVNGKPSLTIDQAATKLTGGEPGWNSVMGSGYTVSYAYRASEPTTYPSDISGFTRFSVAQINQTELALKGWSDVANIHFVRVGTGTSGDAAYSDNAPILIGNYSSGEAGAAAFAYYPGDTSVSSSSGDLWVNSTLDYNQAPAVGNFGGIVLVHELGHTIGLGHPGVVDHDVDATIALKHRCRLLLDKAKIAHVSGERHHLVTLGAQQADGLVKRRRAQIRHCHRKAAFQESAHAGQSDPPCGAGDDCNFQVTA